jgi:hypothetical protein
MSSMFCIKLLSIDNNTHFTIRPNLQTMEGIVYASVLYNCYTMC